MILVTGSTGSVGSRLVQLLAESGERVRAVVQPGQSPPWSAALGVEAVAADYDDPAALAEAALGADRVFVLVPPAPGQVAWQDNILHASRRSDYIVKLSAFDTGADSPLTMGRWHHAGEQTLGQTGIAHTLVRPQYFMQNLLSSPAITATSTLPTFIEPTTAVGMVDASDVAAVAAALLTAADPVPDEAVVPTGPRAVTVQQVASELGRALEREITVDFMEAERGRAVMRARGLPDWHIDDVLTICTTASALVTDDVPRLTGRAARDIATVVDECAAEQRQADDSWAAPKN